MNRGEHGASLVEVLVSLSFLGLLATDMHQFGRAMLRGIRVLESTCEAEEAARIGSGMIVHDLRSAGYGASASLGNGLRFAATDAVEVGADLNADGDTDDAQEVVGYRLDRDRHLLMRVMAGVAQPMLTDLGSEGLQLAYYAADGSTLSGPGGVLDDDSRRRVRRIDIIIAIEAAHPDPAYPTPIRARQTASVCLRNG